jgi:hypothetical protein
VVPEPSQTIGDNLNNVRCENSRPFKEERENIRREKINELRKSSKTKNTERYTEINEYKNGYQHRSNAGKGGNNDRVADSHDILNR